MTRVCMTRVTKQVYQISRYHEWMTLSCRYIIHAVDLRLETQECELKNIYNTKVTKARKTSRIMC